MFLWQDLLPRVVFLVLLRYDRRLPSHVSLTISGRICCRRGRRPYDRPLFARPDVGAAFSPCDHAVSEEGPMADNPSLHWMPAPLRLCATRPPPRKAILQDALRSTSRRRRSISVRPWCC